MWRAWVVMVIAFTALAPPAEASLVSCSVDWLRIDNRTFVTPPTSGYLATVDHADLLTVSSFVEQGRYWTNTAGGLVALGAECHPTTAVVLMSLSSYNTLRDTVKETTFNSAVTSFTALLLDVSNYMILGWIIFAMLMGFIFGWRVVQRGGSQ